MKARWLSTFTILGLLLIGLGIYGVYKGSGFVFDPGQISDGKEAWYYLIIGVFMVLNGLFFPPPLPSEEAADKKTAAVKSGDKTDDASAGKAAVKAGRDS